MGIISMWPLSMEKRMCVLKTVPSQSMLQPMTKELSRIAHHLHLDGGCLRATWEESKPLLRESLPSKVW